MSASRSLMQAAANDGFGIRRPLSREQCRPTWLWPNLPRNSQDLAQSRRLRVSQFAPIADEITATAAQSTLVKRLKNDQFLVRLDLGEGWTQRDAGRSETGFGLRASLRKSGGYVKPL